jgi:bacterioferritin-associated ferredoxin
VDFWYPAAHVVNFKRDVYDRALRQFAPLVESMLASRWAPSPRKPRQAATSAPPPEQWVPRFTELLLTIIRIRTEIRTMYICMCNAVTDHDIRRAAADGVRFAELQTRTGCSDCCGCCESEARHAG